MFALKDTKKETESIIFLIYHHKGNRFKISTQLKIIPDHWNKESQRARKIKEHPEYIELNYRLDNYDKAIKDVIYKLTNDGKKLTNELIKDELQIKLGLKVKEEKPDFLTFADKFMEQSKKSISIHVYTKLHGSIKLLKDFEKEYGKFDYDDIDINFYREFMAFLKKKKYSDNYIGSVIKSLKRILNEATELGLNKSINFRSRNFKIITERVYHTYLTMDELVHLHKFQFKQKYISDARDRFLIGAFTGLRFSDYNQLKYAHFSEDQFITKDMHKVNARVIVPLHWIVKEILERRNYNLPEPISNQKMNDYLKIMGDEAKINNSIIQTITKGGVRTQIIKPKYKFISTHTARRSMATNMFISGIDLLTISKLLGHSTINQTMTYIQISEQEMAKKLADHPFFNKS